MRLAQHSLPKMNPENDGGKEHSVGFSFCPLEDGVERAQPRFGGKTLFVSDTRSMGCFATFARNLRSISVVFESDALPLFSMPDGVGSVFAAGGEETLKAARFFAAVRRVPCVLFPAEAHLRGVLEERGEILLCGKHSRVPLARGEIKIDLDLCKSSFAEAFASLLSARLALIEQHALQIFCGKDKSLLFEQMFTLTEVSHEPDAGELVFRNYAIKSLQQRGAPAGECEVLVQMHRAAGDSFPIWRSYVELSALYGAFFACGKPRKYAVPDYDSRARRANTKFCNVKVPTPEEYETRASLLEQMRPVFSAELQLLQDRKEFFENVFRKFTAQEPPKVNFALVKTLPEQVPEGLSAIIRDFGLLDF